MKRIFLTGATGVMGSHGLRELSSYPERYEITVLARDSKKNRRLLLPFMSRGVKVIWGDLLDKEAVARGVSDADIVLHVGGMVSPAADWFPEKTMETNVKSMENIIQAALPRKNEVRIVYVGSVSQYGSRLAPNHWGSCADELKMTPFDAYAYSKIKSERLLIESGIKWWVSLRQTGILHSGLLQKADDPIMFHVPLKGVLEWVTAEDSGRVLERVCRDDIPDDFWRKCYNLGGGEKFRLTNYEFECKLLDAMGCPAPEKIFETNWFATDNFHGVWFADSDKLEEVLKFRSGDSPSEYFHKMKKELPWYFSLAPLAPSFIIKLFMKKVANKPVLGPLWWIKNNVARRISAAWGSKEEWERIPDWPQFDLRRPTEKHEIAEDIHADDCAEHLIHVRCDHCGEEYEIKKIAYAFGHRCPKCLEIFKNEILEKKGSN